MDRPNGCRTPSVWMATLIICTMISFLFMIGPVQTVSRTCPRGCDCFDNDPLLVTRCNKSAQLDYVPHTLNPAVKELHLSNNNIKGIKSAFEVYKNLVFLDLSFNSLQSINEKNFVANSKLETILLTHNNISVVHLNSFVGLVSLRKLDLSSNKLHQINGSLFQNMKQLTELDLSYNNIDYLASEAFVGLGNLKYLNISNNKLSQLNVLFKQMPNLLKFNVSFNDLSHITKNEFNNLNQLTELDLSHCRISQIESSAFHDLNNLVVLYLNNNYLTRIPSHSFGFKNVLQSLHIGQNPFESILSNSFENLKFLKMLHIINASMLSNVEYNAFRGLDNLEMLELSFNENLQHIDRNLFDNLFSLSSLILSNNQFTTLEIDLINRYKKMDLYLDVRGNPFNCNCTLEWLNFHLIRMFNKTISANKDYFANMNQTFLMHNINHLLNNNQSHMIIQENALDVRCVTPFALKDKPIIKLHKDKFGCFVLESIIPIVVGAIIGFMIIVGVIVLLIIRCKYRLSGFVKNQLFVEKQQKPFDLYEKPDYLYMDYSLYQGNPSRLYEEVSSVHYPLQITPTTQL